MGYRPSSSKSGRDRPCCVIRPYAELAFYIAGVFLVVGLWFTYVQLRLLKRDMLLRVERAAKEKAIEAGRLYFERYVPQAAGLSLAREEAKIRDYRGPIGDFSLRSLPPTWRPDRKFISLQFNTPLNTLELIASLFTTGVADERTGFTIIGRTFCGTVEHNYDLIAFCRIAPAHAYWSNIVQLYGQWRPRLSKAELQALGDSIDEQLNKMKDDSAIPPIGLEA
jgi:hypothetical protein